MSNDLPGLDGGQWPASYYEDESPFRLSGGDLIPKRATVRPVNALPRKRPRRQPRETPDAETVERIEWVEWVRDQILATTEHRDHWFDPRWDDLPPEWEFKVWKAARQRARTNGRRS